MPTFAYKAMTDSGSTVTGTLTADSPDTARSMIADQGYFPTKVTRVRGSGGSEGGLKALEAKLTRVKAPELILFTKQFRTMLTAGISMVKILEVLESQTENKKLKAAIIDIQRRIREGSTVYEAFSRHRDVFNDLYCNMLRAGEQSGSLPDVLDRLIYLIQHEHNVKRDIKSALTYPTLVVIMLFGAFFFLLTFVVPKFVATFEQVGLDLPMPTKICLMLYQFLNSYWPFLMGGFAAFILSLIMFLRTDQGKYLRDMIILNIPLIGPIFAKSAMSRFASIFAILQRSGVTVLESIGIISGTIGNAAIAREFDLLREKLEQGRGISGPLRSSKYFPPMVINMVAIGEESGNLDEMLSEVSSHYDYEVSYAINRMSQLIGPILIVVLAGVVGFFALAIFLPMWDMTKMVKM